MDFGKLPSVDGIRFELPPDPPRTLEVLSRSRRSGPPRVHVGAPVWSCPEWVGKVYPGNTPARDFLKFYSRQFASIELNSSFYAIPSPKSIDTWKKTVPSGFKFAPKLPQSISHQTPSMRAERDVARFFEAVTGLGDSLGTCFLQLPPQFGPDQAGHLRRLLRAIPTQARLAVEFRHPAWFSDHEIRREILDALAERGFATVITDVAGRRDVLHACLTVPQVMIRFVGNELHPSDFARIDDWVERLKSWLDGGLEELYFFVHHPSYINVPELASDFIRKMNARCGLALRDWTPMDAGPDQMSFF